MEKKKKGVRPLPRADGGNNGRGLLAFFRRSLGSSRRVVLFCGVVGIVVAVEYEPDGYINQQDDRTQDHRLISVDGDAVHCASGDQDEELVDHDGPRDVVPSLGGYVLPLVPDLLPAVLAPELDEAHHGESEGDAESERGGSEDHRGASQRDHAHTDHELEEHGVDRG